MVDAHVSGTCVARHGGSSPLLGTTYHRPEIKEFRDNDRFCHLFLPANFGKYPKHSLVSSFMLTTSFASNTRAASHGGNFSGKRGGLLEARPETLP